MLFLQQLALLLQKYIRLLRHHLKYYGHHHHQQQLKHQLHRLWLE
jgi:hypothetical protein